MRDDEVVGRDEAQVDSTPDLEPQVMLILVGLPGSSKSTFSNALVEASQTDVWRELPPCHRSEAVSKRSEPSDDTSRTTVERVDSPSSRRRPWTRVSQDEAPSRRRQECEVATRTALARGDNVVIDRVNFDPACVRRAQTPILYPLYDSTTDTSGSERISSPSRGSRHPGPLGSMASSSLPLFRRLKTG